MSDLAQDTIVQDTAVINKAATLTKGDKKAKDAKSKSTSPKGANSLKAKADQSKKSRAGAKSKSNKSKSSSKSSLPRTAAQLATYKKTEEARIAKLPAAQQKEAQAKLTAKLVVLKSAIDKKAAAKSLPRTAAELLVYKKAQEALIAKLPATQQKEAQAKLSATLAGVEKSIAAKSKASASKSTKAGKKPADKKTSKAAHDVKALDKSKVVPKLTAKPKDAVAEEGPASWVSASVATAGVVAVCACVAIFSVIRRNRQSKQAAGPAADGYATLA